MEPPSSPTSTSSVHDPFTLTPIRAHYLKKSLIQLQFAQEIQTITSTSINLNVSTLSYLGPPFSPPPRDAPIVDLPFLRYLFRQYVLTFPFLVSAPKDFFPDKVQPFISSLLSRNLYSNSILDDESPDPAGTTKLIAKAERSFALFLNYAVKIVEKEETVRLSQSDLDKLETIARRRHAKLMKTKDVFDVNIVCVRTVVHRGRVRSKAHEVRSHDTQPLYRSMCGICRSSSFEPSVHIAKTCTCLADMGTLGHCIKR
jgi:PX-associated